MVHTKSEKDRGGGKEKYEGGKILEKEETERDKVKCKLFLSQTSKYDKITQTELYNQSKNLVAKTDRHEAHGEPEKESKENLKRKNPITKVQEQKGGGHLRNILKEVVMVNLKQ